MALAETANLLVKLSLGGNFLSQIKKVNSSLGKLDKTQGRAYLAGQQIGTGIKRGAALAAAGVGLLATNVALGLDSLIKLEEATAQTDAVIKSTGGTAGITATQVRKLAEQYESLNATIGDEVIQSAENMLLTFTKINGKAFEPALQAALDMNTAMGRGPDGLQTTIIQVGKALNDPIHGLTALRRVGVTFTKEQEGKIKSLQKEGKLYEAQQLILQELNKEFGGSFVAQGSTTAGKVAKFTDSIEDLQRALAGALLPAIGNVADELTKFLSDPQTVRDFEELGREIGRLFSPENIRNGISALKDGFNFLKGIAGPIADVIGTAVRAFTGLPPDIQKLLVGGFVANKLTGGLVTNIAGGIFGALKAMTVQAAVVNVNGGVVNGGGIPGAGGAGGGVAAFVAGTVASGVALAAALAITDKLVNEPARQGAAAKNIDATQGLMARGSSTDIKAAISNLSTLPDRLDPLQKALYELNANGVKTHTEDLVTALKDALPKAIAAENTETTRETKKGLAFLTTKTNSVKQAQVETKRETAKGAALTSATTRSTTAAQTGAIVGAIWAAQPQITVNVTGNSVSSSNTRRGRYGSQTGSRNADWTDYGRGGVH